MTVKFQERHEQVLQQLLARADIPAPLLREALQYSLFPGGKRIRPLLVYLVGDLLEVNPAVLDIIAAAIELTHSYSLIHDDLPAMDNDDLRRGRPSCHKAFDEATAILVGDGLQAMAFQVLFEQLPCLVTPSQVIAIAFALVKASGLNGMISGQSLDLTELQQADTDEVQLTAIHRLKTGKLLSACVAMVLAAMDSVDEESKAALTTYIKHLGLVFQMQDDYLDQYASHSDLGKNRSSDLANEKCTFASLFPKHQLEEKIKEEYQKAIQALAVFGDKNKALIQLTEQLQQRS